MSSDFRSASYKPRKRIRFVIGELLSEVGGQVGHGLVLAWFEMCVLRLVFLDSSLQSPEQEKYFGILLTPFRNIVCEIQLSVRSMVFGSIHSLIFITWHFETASTPEREKHFGNLFVHVCMPYGSGVSFIGEEEKRKLRFSI